MKILSTVALAVLACTGLVAQSFAQRFQEMQPELDSMHQAMEYKALIDKIEAFMPPAIPAFDIDAENPDVGLASFYDFEALQSFHVYLGRAYAMYGHLESAGSNFKKAEEIARLNATEIDGVFGPIIQNWNNAGEMSKKALENLETIKKQKEEIEAKGRRQSRQERELLARIKEREPFFDENAPIWQANIERAPAMVEQLNLLVSATKEDTGKFAPAIAALEADVKSEGEMIETKFGGDKAKYVESVIDTKENLTSLTTQEDKVKFLNRLLFLDPQNKEVKEQLDSILGKS
ncbi:MAG: hypothetical protein FWG12_05290 [Holophagaceae bacterium]|nr:hypothetical protein [Holophagaceae bacterium]